MADPESSWANAYSTVMSRIMGSCASRSTSASDPIIARPSPSAIRVGLALRASLQRPAARIRSMLVRDYPIESGNAHAVGGFAIRRDAQPPVELPTHGINNSGRVGNGNGNAGSEEIAIDIGSEEIAIDIGSEEIAIDIGSDGQEEFNYRVRVMGRTTQGVLVQATAGIINRALSHSSYSPFVGLAVLAGIVFTGAGIATRDHKPYLSRVLTKTGTILAAGAIIASICIPLPPVVAGIVGPLSFLIAATAVVSAT